MKNNITELIFILDRSGAPWQKIIISTAILTKIIKSFPVGS